MSYRTILAGMLAGLICTPLMPSAMADTNTKNAVRVAGTLTRIGGKILTIASTEGKDITITCGDTTKFSREADKALVPAKFADLQAGQQIRSYYSKVDNIAFAVLIAKAPAVSTVSAPRNTVRVTGKLARISGKTLTIISSEGRNVTITCPETTKISRETGNQVTAARFEDLQAGQQVLSYYSKSNNVASAVVIASSPATPPGPDTRNAKRIAGRLTRINGKAITIAPVEGEDVTITCGESTKITLELDKAVKPGKFGDLQIGQQLRAYYFKSDNGAFAIFIANPHAVLKPKK